jgi:hypothetical protein
VQVTCELDPLQAVSRYKIVCVHIQIERVANRKKLFIIIIYFYRYFAVETKQELGKS